MAVKKNKLNDVAKSFNIPNKVLIELLGKYFEGEKKVQTALEDKEMDVIFEVLTREHSVESFDAYFAMQPEKKEKPKAEAKTEEKKEDNKDEKAAAEKKAEKPAENKPAKANAGAQKAAELPKKKESKRR